MGNLYKGGLYTQSNTNAKEKVSLSAGSLYAEAYRWRNMVPEHV